MKFVSSKRVSDYAFQLFELNEEKEKLNARLKEIKAEEKSLEDFLAGKTNQENFQFADPSDYLMELDFVPGSRLDIDGNAVRRFYAKMGKKVPMKRATWLHVKVKYVTEYTNNGA